MLKSYAFRNQCYSSKDRKTQNNNLDNQKIDQYYTVTADTPLTAISTSRRPALAIPYVISTQETAYRHINFPASGIDNTLRLIHQKTAYRHINFLARHSRNPLPPYQLPGTRHWQYAASYPVCSTHLKPTTVVSTTPLQKPRLFTVAVHVRVTQLRAIPICTKTISLPAPAAYRHIKFPATGIRSKLLPTS